MSYIISEQRVKQFNGTQNRTEYSASIICDDVASLPTNNSDYWYLLGSDAKVISNGKRYIINSSGVWVEQPSENAWENIYTKAEVEAMINTIYDTMMYYHAERESTDGTITFYTFGENVGKWAIYGNGQQIGTPSPQNIIMPDLLGKKVGADWTIPISCGGQTVPVYLGQVQTVRKVKKLVLDGTEEWALVGVDYIHGLYIDDAPIENYDAQICSHFIHVSSWSELQNTNNSFGISSLNRIVIHDESIRTVEDFKSYLASQYAAGHPVTIWYVLATEQTGIVNEPLAKIDDYADELHSEDAGVTIPTVKGSNTLTVDTDLKPSKIVISGESN